MRIPVVRGTIDRRILINYRVDPSVLALALPKPFRPKLIDGFGIAGVCLIRLAHVRPRYLPGMLGFRSENAAHRIAVEWEQGAKLREGVFIPRRDTSSRFNALVGGRLFPGVHHLAQFKVHEADGYYSVALHSNDDETHLSVDAHSAECLPLGSLFTSLDEASEFFRLGSIGYSSTLKHGHFDGLELRTFNWLLRPLAVDKVESSLFGNRRVFPAGSVEFDSAFLMTNVDHEWHACQPLCAT